MKYKLKIITSTTRPGRKGALVADWAVKLALTFSEYEVELLDLAQIALPFLDEAEDPKAGNYQHEHTRAWSRRIEEADAFIFVLAEYNHGYPAPVKNALDYLYKEWHHKPVGLISYAGLSGGTRSVEALQGTLLYLKMVPLAEAVHIPFFEHYLSGEDKFEPEEKVTGGAKALLKALDQWIPALQSLRMT